MHRLLAKFGLALVALLAFLGVDLYLAPPLTQMLWGMVWAGQVVAFVISGGVAFVILLAGWSVTAGQLHKLTK